ncbi:MAG: hypothetical protein IJK81_13350 [Selenomonadaceae bacterium]|nr:hypothetical protein [Selenomonadaceae bacterium]
MYGTDDWEQFLRQQESPQLIQGLLGSVGEPNHTLDEIISNGMNKAAQLGQFAQPLNPTISNDLIAQRQNSTQQLAQQAMAQQNQQDAQNIGLLAQIAKMFFK